MNGTPTSLAARLRPTRGLLQPGTAEARAAQAVLAFWLLAVGSLLATGLTLAGRPHAAILLPVALVGFPLAVFCAWRHERMGPVAWQLVAATAAVAVGMGTVLDPQNWALSLILYVFFVCFIAFFFPLRALAAQLSIVLAGIAGAAAAQAHTRFLVDWLLVGVTLVAVGATVVIGRRALWGALGQLQQEVARQEAIAELGSRALAEPDLTRALDDAVRLVVRELLTDDAVVLEQMPSKEALLVRASFLATPDAGRIVPVGRGSFSGYTLLVDEPVVSEDLAAETRFSPTGGLLASGFVSAANVIVPGVSGPFGVLGVRSKTRRHFGESDLAFLQAVANVLGAAVRNVAMERTLARSRSGASELSDRLEALIDASPLPIAELDNTGRVRLWNRAAEQTFGWQRAELIGTPYPIVPADERTDFEDVVANLRANGGLSRTEADRVRKDGTRVRCEIHAAAIHDANGEVTSLIAIIADISERVRTEQELARSQELYRTVVENSQDLIALLDPDGVVLYASPSYATVLGRDPADLVGTQIRDIVHPDDIAPSGEALARALHLHATASTDARLLRADGDWAYVEGTISALVDKQGELQSILSTCRDVSERHEAQDELRQAELRYRTLVEQLPLITYVHPPDDRQPWTYFSPQLQAILGYEDADWQGDAGFYARILEPQDRARVLSTRAATTGRLSLEYRVVGRDGRVAWVRDEAIVVRDLAGRALYVQGYMLDTTAEREADRNRRGLEAQLLQSQKMEAVGRLAGGIAHDFNNLLTAITGYSELLLGAMPPGSDDARDVEQIRRAAAQAASMTQQLLAFSRRQVLQPKVMSLNDTLAEMEAMLRRLIGENVVLSTSPDPDLQATRSDLAQIEQVVLNLCLNARDAMPDGGRLEVRTANADLDEAAARAAGTHPGTHVLLEVRDSGHGMDSETLEHAFEPFFTTKEQGKGTGLGLATVLGIVQQSGGGIAVETAPGAGTTFRIYLPAVGEALTHDETATDRPERGHEAILLVEDESIVRELLARVLRTHGYAVIEAANGEEALAIAHAEPTIDLLLTDVVMPGMSGRELSERLAAQRPGLRILYMSGYTDEAIVHHGVREGEAEFIAKPFTPDALARKVRGVLDAALERV